MPTAAAQLSIAILVHAGASYAQLSKVLGHKQNMMAELTHEQALDSWHSLAGPSSPAAEPPSILLGQKLS